MIQAINCNQLYSEATIFSQGIVADEFTFVAADARGPDGSVEDRSATAQCIRSCEALRLALNSCGQDLQNLVSLTVFLADYAEAAEIIAALHSQLDRSATPANIAEMDRRFVEQFGGPENEQILVLPLVLKDKVAALLYADGGADGVLDGSSLEVLVLATSAWLEVTSLRKQAQRELSDTMPSSPQVAAPVQTVSSFSDPFAAHTPKHIAPQAAPEPEPAAEVVEVAAHAAGASAASAPATAADPFAGMSAEDADTHRKAQRFARLLVDEIKLYNQAKVAEGRRNKDLYDRLKEDIEKSRSTFQKRYGNSAAASGEYFQKEVVRSLAEDDTSVMGASFRK